MEKSLESSSDIRTENVIEESLGLEHDLDNPKDQ